MKRIQKNAFGIELRRRARRFQVRYVLPVAVLLFIVILFLYSYWGRITGQGVIGAIMLTPRLYVIICILAYIFLVFFLWIGSRSNCEKRAFEQINEEISIATVDKTMVPGKFIEVGMIKPEDSRFGRFVMDLQYKYVDYYATLSENDDCVSIYAVLDGNDEKIKVEDIPKKKFFEYYQYLRYGFSE